MPSDRITEWNTGLSSERQWIPTQHELDRIRRLTREHGQFKSCRHYKRANNRSFTCKGKERKTCNGCGTCPNCNGMMILYRRRTEKGYDRDDIYLIYTYISRTCIQCGAYIEDEFVSLRREERYEIHTSSEGKCDVRGCRNTAYEGHHHNEAGHTYTICETHRRRIKTWRHHPEKGPEHNPLMVVKGVLMDNPEYHIKQEKGK